MDKILVPLDGSELGELALVYAAELAISLNSETHLVSSCEKSSKEDQHMCDLYLHKVAEKFRSQLKEAGTILPVKTVAVAGEPSGAILDYAEKQGIGLIIIVSHGRSGIMPWATGGTANKIIHRAPMPVLLVRAAIPASSMKTGLFTKILVTLDGSKMGEAVLPYVQAIARKLTCQVVLLRVVEPVQHLHSIALDQLRLPEQDVVAMQAEAKSYLARIQGEAESYLIGARQRCGEIRDSVRMVLKTGDAAREILNVAEEEDVNLVAMSSHGKTGMTQWMLGSVSNKILQAGKTPLLLVKPTEIIG